MFTAQDHEYMAHAIRLAEQGRYTTDPNPRVGCVLVRDNRIVGEGWHERAGGPHAEIAALQQAGSDAQGATAYVTLEPCCHQGRTPPCTAALIAAGVKKVIAAMPDPNPLMQGKGLQQCQEAGLEVASGLSQAQAEALNPGYILRMNRHRPLVRCKMAMTLDGRTATQSGESQWITGPDARQDVQHLRAGSSAVMTGIGTVLDDDPSMNVRIESARQPRRIIIDSHLRTPPQAKILRIPGEVLIYCAHQTPEKSAALEAQGATVICQPAHHQRVDLAAVLNDLAERQVNEVLLEAGATLAGAMIAAGLVDELIIYMAPRLLGSDGRGLLKLPGIEQLADAVQLKITDIRAVGDDWRITSKLGSE